MNDISSFVSSIKQAKWQTDTTLNRFFLPENLKYWMCDKGSLTSSLRNISENNFEVEVIRQRKSLPFWHETKIPKSSPNVVSVIREVHLKLHGVPVIYARSVIPLELALPGRFGLNNLGSTPLGHLLFRDGRIRNSRREFTTVTKTNDIPNDVFGRRTPYEYRDSTILVSEFFLPSFYQFI